jgi:hypothetical protein
VRLAIVSLRDVATGRNSPATPGNGPPLRLLKRQAGTLQIHSSDSDVSANGYAPPIDDDEPEIDDDHAGSQYDFSELFNAPSYSEFIKIKPNSTAQTYERRVQSMMKAGLVMSLNSQEYPDAATFLKHGPGFATAAGNLAAVDARAKQVIDILTAPDSPYVMFLLAAMPMISQLARNHQPEIKQAGASMKERRAERKRLKVTGQSSRPVASPITVRIFKREFKIPIRFRVRLPKLQNIFKAFLTPTQHPVDITREVFQDPAVIKALNKMGIYPQDASNREAA